MSLQRGNAVDVALQKILKRLAAVRCRVLEDVARLSVPGHVQDAKSWIAHELRKILDVLSVAGMCRREIEDLSLQRTIYLVLEADASDHFLQIRQMRGRSRIAAKRFQRAIPIGRATQLFEIRIRCQFQ